MHLERLPDCHSPRPDASVTSASAHPELICGELAMRPRLPISLDAADRIVIDQWWRRLTVMVLLIMTGLAMLTFFERDQQPTMRAGDMPAEVARLQPMP
jgi:hypothetical protein